MAQKHKVKDLGRQKALGTFEKLGDDKNKEKMKALDDAKKAAMAMSKDKEFAETRPQKWLRKRLRIGCAVRAGSLRAALANGTLAALATSLANVTASRRKLTLV